MHFEAGLFEKSEMQLFYFWRCLVWNTFPSTIKMAMFSGCGVSKKICPLWFALVYDEKEKEKCRNKKKIKRLRPVLKTVRGCWCFVLCLFHLSNITCEFNVKAAFNFLNYLWNPASQKKKARVEIEPVQLPELADKWANNYILQCFW